MKQLLIENIQADVITIQETKLNQSHKTPNIPHFTPIQTDRTHKQGGGVLTYIKNKISFSQLNTSNIFPVELHTGCPTKKFIFKIFVTQKLVKIKQ